jgi:hypothetical protein
LFVHPKKHIQEALEAVALFKLEKVWAFRALTLFEECHRMVCLRSDLFQE